MEAAIKELAKLEKLAPINGKGKHPSIQESLGGLVDYLQSLKGADTLDRSEILRNIEARKKDIDEHQKEVYSAMSRLGKALDKVPHPVTAIWSSTSSRCSEIPRPATLVPRLVLVSRKHFSSAENYHLASPSYRKVRSRRNADTGAFASWLVPA